MSEERWYFTKEQLENSPSRRCGIDADKELSQRQQAANFIQDMGQRLQVTQLCINTAIVYMHRFYCFHSFTAFHRNAIASAAVFLAAKVEEQPRKLEHIIRVTQMCLQKGQPPQPNPDRRSEVYLKEAQDLVQNENILLMTLGFDVAIEHPHAFIVKFCHIANASKDLSQTSYFMASNSLHLTTMCLQYKPTVVACFCIHLVCKWSNWQIPKSKENLPWYTYIDQTVTEEQLEQLTNEFLVIFDKCPSRLKKKIQNSQLSSQNPSMSSYPFDVDARKPSNSNSGQHAQPSSSSANSQQSKPFDDLGQQQFSSIHGKNLFLANARVLSNAAAAAPPAANHLVHHSPASVKSTAASIPSSVVNGASTTTTSSSSNNAHDNNVPSTKLPNPTSSVIPPQAARSSSANHALPPPSTTTFISSSHHPHKAAAVSGGLPNPHSSAAVKARLAPVPGHGMPPKEMAHRMEMSRKLPEVKQEPGYVPPTVAAAATAVNNHHHHAKIGGSVGGGSGSSSINHKKDNGLHQESGVRPSGFLPATSISHSDIISNVVKEVAEQNEKQRLITAVKTEPVDEDVKPFIAADVPDSVGGGKAHKSHSIFSPSPIGHGESAKTSPPESHYELGRSRRNRSLSSSSGEPELIPIVKKVETVAGYEDIFKTSSVSVPAASLLSPKLEFGKEKRNHVAPTSNSVAAVKEEPADAYEYGGKLSCSANQPAPAPYADESATSAAGAALAEPGGECTTHSHKKKKKHKEKDKRHDKEKHRHKEKKRHKEEKHRKEHKERDSLKEPGPISPIKITIPRELITPETLGDMPPAKGEKDGTPRLKIKLGKDQLVSSITGNESAAVATTSAAAAAAAAAVAVVPGVKLKIPKEKLKSRKRNRESGDHEETSKKFAYNGPDSRNGY